MMKNSGENFNSDLILSFIPKNSIGAEVGVWKGSSSVKFQKIGLKSLYLIDPWSVSGYEPAKEAGQWDENFFFRKYTKVVGSSDPEDFEKYYDKVFNDVKNMFVNNPEVSVFRGTFEEWITANQEITLDWVYVDGDHSYLGCKTDLDLARKVVKKGGLILGDDLNLPGPSKAVNTFCKENNLKCESYIPHRGRGTQYKIENK